MKNNKVSRAIIRFIGLIPLSLILIHIFAFLGVFVAVAYPLLWLLSPKLTVCLICRQKHKGDHCPLCNHDKTSAKDIYPKTVKSVLLNALFIGLFSLWSLLFVVLENGTINKFNLRPTHKTVSFKIPTKGQYRMGEIFPMDIEIAGIKTPINTVQADLSFDQERLELVDITTEESFANIFVQKEINNEAGYARLTGGLENPGFSGDKGIFGIAYFKGKVPGIAVVEYLPSSLVLANDGKGTNVLKELSKVSYVILADKLTAEEEKLQDQIFFPNENKGASETENTVLGTTSRGDQMFFYEEKEYGANPEVKGSMDTTELEDLSLWETAIEILCHINDTIIETWEKILGIGISNTNRE